jgi:hypothetical protein
MAEVTSRSIFSAADETIRQLDGLHLAERNRRRESARNLEAAVARLDVAASQPDERDPEPGERRDERNGLSAPTRDPVPFVALPGRTSHGGPWGPKMREKLTAIALEKESRRW